MVLNSVERLVVLTDEKLDAELAAVEREVATLQAEVDRVRAKAEVELAIRLKELDAEIFSARLRSTGYLKEQYFNEVEGLAWRDLADDINPLGTASQTNDVFQSLVFQGSMTDETRIRSLLRREAAHNAAEVNAAQVKICEQRMQGLEDLKRELARKIRHAEGIEVAEARLAQATEKLERLRQAQATLTLNGVAYRTVGVFRKNVGEQVASGETIVELLDNDRRFLIVDLPTRAVPEFPAESNVRLQFPGGQKCTGRVREIPPQTAAQASFNRARHNGDAAAFEEVVTLRIDPTGKLWPDVPIGTAVEVSPGE